MSVDPVPQASGSLPSAEVQLMAQQTPQQNQYLNFSTSTTESEVGKFFVSPLPTPSVLLSPPPLTNKTTSKLPNIPDLFYSLDTFVTKEGPSKANVEASAPVKPSKAEKWLPRLLESPPRLIRLSAFLPNGPLMSMLLGWSLTLLCLKILLYLILSPLLTLGIPPLSSLCLVPQLFADDKKGRSFRIIMSLSF